MGYIRDRQWERSGRLGSDLEGHGGGAAGRTRTPNLLIRSQTLCPFELRPQACRREPGVRPNGSRPVRKPKGRRPRTGGRRPVTGGRRWGGRCARDGGRRIGLSMKQLRGMRRQRRSSRGPPTKAYPQRYVKAAERSEGRRWQAAHAKLSCRQITSPNSSGLEGHVLEAGGAGTSDLGFVSVDDPGVPHRGFTRRVSGD